MLFSVIIPIYKVEKYLENCVNSAINQTYKDIEIILVDDGSPDACPLMCDEFAKSDARVKVIHKENGGLSDARNAGLAVATGEYVIFLDSDDCIEPDSCEAFNGIIERNPGVDIIVGNAVRDDGVFFVSTENTNIPEGALSGKEYLYQALKHGFFRTEAWINVYRRAFLAENLLEFKVGLLHEDAEFTPRAIFKAQSVINCKKIFYKYTTNPNSIMHSKNFSKNCRHIYEIGLMHEKNFKESADKKTYKLIMDFMLVQYLSIFNMGRCARYGKEYTHRLYALKNAYKFRTRLHALAFSVCPRFYSYLINKL